MTPPDVTVYSKPDRPFAAKLRAKLVVSRTPHNAVRFQDDPAAAGEIRNMNDGKEIVSPAAVTSSMACSVMSSSRNGAPTVWWHCESTPVGHAAPAPNHSTTFRPDSCRTPETARRVAPYPATLDPWENPATTKPSGRSATAARPRSNRGSMPSPSAHTMAGLYESKTEPLNRGSDARDRPGWP